MGDQLAAELCASKVLNHCSYCKIQGLVDELDGAKRRVQEEGSVLIDSSTLRRAKKLSGEATREVGHAWAEQLMFAEFDGDTKPDVLAMSGLQYLHGFNMTSEDADQRFVGHGPPGVTSSRWLRSRLIWTAGSSTAATTTPIRMVGSHGSEPTLATRSRTHADRQNRAWSARNVRGVRLNV